MFLKKINYFLVEYAREKKFDLFQCSEQIMWKIDISRCNANLEPLLLKMVIVEPLYNESGYNE